LGEIKGKDIIPAHALALSQELNTAAFPSVELPWEQAIRYLRKETFPIPSDTKGYNLITYSGLPLGFVKNIGNRANNLYPQEWRIRKELKIENGKLRIRGGKEIRSRIQ
jgi:NOL1/NOP2/fmu family ribosome biogenesis protein